MYFVTLLLTLLLWVSIIRVVYEGVRFAACLIAGIHFDTDRLGLTCTAMAVSYIMSIIVCGFPS